MFIVETKFCKHISHKVLLKLYDTVSASLTNNIENLLVLNLNDGIILFCSQRPRYNLIFYPYPFFTFHYPRTTVEVIPGLIKGMALQ